MSFARARTIVYWDMVDCPIPDGSSALEIVRNIAQSLVDLGYLSPMSVTVKAFCDVDLIGEALVSTGISVSHVPAEDRHDRRKKMLVDVFCEAADNDTPLNLMLIMGEFSQQSEFIRAFKFLKSTRLYNVFFAQPQEPSKELIDAVTHAWLWSSLSIGGDYFDEDDYEEEEEEDDDDDTDSADN